MLAHRPFAVFIGTIVSEAPTRSETQVRTEGHQRGEGVNLRFSSFVPRFITKQVKANGGSVLAPYQITCENQGDRNFYTR